MTTQIITTKKGKDGIHSVFYFGKEAGWIYPSTVSRTGKKVFKALTIHHSIKHFDTMETAQNWLLGECY